jgi:hypothetical protein
MFWPNHGVEVDVLAAASMGVAAFGWAIYSLNGRRTSNPISATAASFLIAAPICAMGAALFPDGTSVSGAGLLLAIVSGALTSGLGYALWYILFPRLTATAASLTQPSVPVIVLIGGALLLGETVSPATALAAILVLGGVALGASPGRRPRPGESLGRQPVVTPERCVVRPVSGILAPSRIAHVSRPMRDCRSRTGDRSIGELSFGRSLSPRSAQADRRGYSPRPRRLREGCRA